MVGDEFFDAYEKIMLNFYKQNSKKQQIKIISTADISVWGFVLDNYLFLNRKVYFLSNNNTISSLSFVDNNELLLDIKNKLKTTLHNLEK